MIWERVIAVDLDSAFKTANDQPDWNRTPCETLKKQQIPYFPKRRWVAEKGRMNHKLQNCG